MKTYLLVLWIAVNGGPWHEIPTNETYTGENNFNCMSNGMTKADKLVEKELEQGNTAAVVIRCDETSTTQAMVYIREM